jgi:predicted acylesterase/phospholipase RssA
MAKAIDFSDGAKIGYALGGGGARGLSHIGVMKVLEEHGIYPDVIAGTSIGALVGALYASGLRAGDIERALRLDLRRLAMLADVRLSLSGLVQGKRVTSALKAFLGDLDFADLKIPFACVATDIVNGQEIVMRTGPVITAVRASISVPGLFTPVKVRGRYLVDGGLVNMVPSAPAGTWEPSMLLESMSSLIRLAGFTNRRMRQTMKRRKRAVADRARAGQNSRNRAHRMW